MERPKSEEKALDWRAIRSLARPSRLERLTHSLEGCCSIHLSYGRKSREEIALHYYSEATRHRQGKRACGS